MGKLPLLLPTGEAEQHSLQPGEVVRTIESNGSWLALFHLEREEPFRELLDSCVSAFAANFDCEGGIKRTTATVILASPGAVTPAHVDRHHNVLLQIEGTKEVVVGAFDSTQEAAQQVGRHFDLERSNLTALPSTHSSWTLHPGQGLYIPPYAPHWVYANETTLSLSCAVTTARSMQIEMAHICNARLRRIGLRPRYAGTSPTSDRLKATAVRSARRLRRARRRIVPVRLGG